MAGRSSLPWLQTELHAHAAGGLRRSRRVVRPLRGGACEIDGRRLWNFASNDYLGLAADPRTTEAAQRVLLEAGVGSRASALVTGRTKWHEELEQALARFEGQESAVLFPTGYAANVGTIAALVEETDIVFCDRLNHASLIDGCRLSGAKLRVFRHRVDDRLESIAEQNLTTLARELAKSARFRRRLIVTDGAFSMDGDVAPLREICELAERFDADLLVDEAHGTGVFGEKGRGVCEELQVESRVAVRVGTLSKAIGALGGFVAGPQSLIDWLWNKARPQIFSTSLPPAICAAATAAIEILEREPELRAKLWSHCDFVRYELARRGISVLENSVGPIIPIVFGDPATAMAAQQKLETRGCLVAAIRPPTVPHGTSRLRITVSAAHDEAALNCLVDALGEFSLA